MFCIRVDVFDELFFPNSAVTIRDDASPSFGHQSPVASTFATIFFVSVEIPTVVLELASFLTFRLIAFVVVSFVPAIVVPIPRASSFEFFSFVI
jgi:hypothetical protein